MARIGEMMFSKRYGRDVMLTDHARKRMAQRDIDERVPLDLIETGEMRCKDEDRLWIAKHYPVRSDNLLCAAVVLETVLVVKTVMHHFTWEPEP